MQITTNLNDLPFFSTLDECHVCFKTFISEQFKLFEDVICFNTHNETYWVTIPPFYREMESENNRHLIDIVISESNALCCSKCLIKCTLINEVEPFRRLFFF